MSCGCGDSPFGGNDTYNNLCNSDTPYPITSAESVPALISNLTLALYGEIQKDASSGKVVWIIPCDPSNTASLPYIARNEGEGLLCYMLRVFALITPPLTVSSVKTEDITLALSDSDTFIQMGYSGSSRIYVSVPENSSVPFRIGTQIQIQQFGASRVTVVGNGAVQLKSPDSYITSKNIYSVMTLTKINTNVWSLNGELNAG